MPWRQVSTAERRYRPAQRVISVVEPRQSQTRIENSSAFNMDAAPSRLRPRPAASIDFSSSPNPPPPFNYIMAALSWTKVSYVCWTNVPGIKLFLLSNWIFIRSIWQSSLDACILCMQVCVCASSSFRYVAVRWCVLSPIFSLQTNNPC